MSVKIRLAKFGKKHAPSYRLVVTHTRTKRNGKFLDIIGHFNPSDKTSDPVIDKAKYEEWMKKGAQQTEAVQKLIEGKYEHVKYEPKKEAASEEKKTEEPVAEKTEEENAAEEA